MINKKTAGFTLFELMIVIGIIGVLATIAYPSYTEKVQKSRRADAKGALMGFAGAMERHFTVAGSYCDVGKTAAVTECGDSTNDTGTPAIYATQSPVDGGEAYYDLTISKVSSTSFELSATPINQQETDKCGTLTLTNVGIRGVSKASVPECW